METNVSFIISIDSSYEMVNNFFEHFLKNTFVQNSEIIIVDDCTYNTQISTYLNQLNANHSNLFVYRMEHKVGYGVANNYAVKHCNKEYLFFINTDVFVIDNCFEVMFEKLNENNVCCVQPLLIWPQNNKIQCAGSTFGYYYKNHLFAGRSIESIDLNTVPNERQALTSALYAMRKKDFYDYNMFDEFYYNKLESFELSLKMSLNGQRCLCLYDARAYHSQGAGRGQYFLDFYQQEAYFWSHFGNKIIPDLQKYLDLQITEEMCEHLYSAITITQTHDCVTLLDSIKLDVSSYYKINGINPKKINLYDLLPYSFHVSIKPLLFFVDNIMNLNSNKQWFKTRKNDLVIDTYGNLVYAHML